MKKLVPYCVVAAVLMLGAIAYVQWNGHQQTLKAEAKAKREAVEQLERDKTILKYKLTRSDAASKANSIGINAWMLLTKMRDEPSAHADQAKINQLVTMASELDELVVKTQETFPDLSKAAARMARQIRSGKDDAVHSALQPLNQLSQKAFEEFKTMAESRKWE